MRRCLINPCDVTEVFPAEKENALSVSPYTFVHYSQQQQASADYWGLAQASGDRFLQRDYLSLLEEYPPAGMQFGYVLVRRAGRAVGMAYCQLLEFRASEHIRNIEEVAASCIRTVAAKHLKFRLLICGNILLTGPHAYYFLPDEEQTGLPMLREALHKIARHIRKKGEKLDAIVIKDVEEKDRHAVESWRNSGLQQFRFQPNMVLPIPAGWRSMEDYQEALTSKYRVRYRRAQKKLAGVQRHELNERQIRSFEPELYALYRQVADSSEFCMAYLHPQYLSAAKARAGEDFRLWAYFQGEQIIGFCTAFWNGCEMEAHFLGLDKERQEGSQLYLNMLFHLIGEAIEGRASQLIFSRTALAIKSSVGAIPVGTSLFLTFPFSPLLNCLAPYLVDWLEPKTDWEARHPFRGQETEVLFSE